MTLTFLQDFKEKKLVPIKLLLCLQAAGDMALYPFLTLHMKYLGISVSDIGIQFAVSPVATLIATPLVGLLADKIGNFKVMLSISLFICAAVSQLFLLVPEVKTIPLERNRTTFPCAEMMPAKFTEGIFKECQTSCNGENNTVIDLCFLNTTIKNCTAKKFDFEVKMFNNTNITESVLFIYNNLNYDSIMCDVYENQSCIVECQSGKQLFMVDPDSKVITFWGYLVIRVGLFVIIATEMSLLKAAILTLLHKYDSDYGFQRLWSSVAVCIVPPITGVIMDKLKNGEVEDYRPCFYIYGGMKVLMALITLVIDISVKPPTLDVWKNLGKLLKNPEVDVLLFYCAFLGSCWGYLETFFLWYMEGLGASKSLMGLTFTVGAVSGIPVTLVAGALARRFGHVPLISFALLVYCGRFIGYSFITSPYEALSLEAMECITMGLMMITITTYSNMLAGQELVATMQATWAALHFAVGRAIGSMIGGFLMEEFGTRTTYRIFAVASIFMGIIYFVIYQCWFRRRNPNQSSEINVTQPEKGVLKNIQYSTDNIKSITKNDNNLKRNSSKEKINCDEKPKYSSNINQSEKRNKGETEGNVGLRNNIVGYDNLSFESTHL